MNNGNVPILDIYIASYLALHGIMPTLTKQGTRVIFEFPGDDRTLMVMESYNKNPCINLLEYVTQLRRMRAMMLAKRDGR